MQIRVKVQHGAHSRVKTRKAKHNADNGGERAPRTIRYQDALVYGLREIAFTATKIKLKENQEPYPPGDYEIDADSFNISAHGGILRGDFSGVTLTPAHPDDPITRMMNQVAELATSVHHSAQIDPRPSCQSP